MPFVVAGGGRLEDRIDENAPGRCARRIADVAADRLEANIQRLTPVDLSPGRDRSRPHLRDTIHRTRVTDYPTPIGHAFGATVETFDPIGPDVEWNTKPHDIPGAFGYGHDFGIGGRFEGKFHPGTQGHHMFARGTAETDSQMREIAAEPLRELQREIFKSR